MAKLTSLEYQAMIDTFVRPHDCASESGVIGSGAMPCDVMGIGIAPGVNEWQRTKRPFTGAAGKLLDGTLGAVGWLREKMYLTNLICWWNDAPTEEEIAYCRPRLNAEIASVNPVLIILFGSIASDSFLGKKQYKRGRFVYKDNRWYLPTYHPAAFLRRDVKVDIADLARDLSKIEFASKWRDKIPPDVEPIIAESAEEASAILWSVNGDNVIDIESSYDGKPFAYPDIDLVGNSDSKLLCFSVTNERGTWVIPGRFIGGIRKGWGGRENVNWIMHLGMFDKGKLKRLLGEDLRITEDTLLMSYSLDERGGAIEENERAVGVHGLKTLASEFLGAPDYDINVLSASERQLHHYNAQDTYYDFGLYNYFKPRQIKDGVREMYEKILIPGANVLSEIQEYGVFIDQEVMYDFGAKWSEKWLTLNDRLLNEAYDTGWPITEEFNLGSWQQLSKYLYDILGCKPHYQFGRSTRREVIDDLARNMPWCADLVSWRGYNHMLGSYITGVLDDLKWDGRAHPEPILHGTRSGRLAYHKPPIQTIPKHGVSEELAGIRRMFAASDNEHVIIEADLKQAEMWATAYLADDDVMLNALASGDAHALTAKEVFNVDESHSSWKAYREIGKLFNFGTLYNRTADGYAKNPFQGRKPPAELEGWTVSKREAQKIIDRLFVKYPKIRTWQHEQIREAFKTGEQVTRTGRKRRYWLPNFKTMNQSVNVGPQSLAHDYLFDSLMKCHHALPEYDGHVLYEVHDALIIEARKSWLSETIDLIQRIMTEPKFGLGGIPVDIAVGPNWAEVKKVA